LPTAYVILGQPDRPVFRHLESIAAASSAPRPGAKVYAGVRRFHRLVHPSKAMTRLTAIELDPLVLRSAQQGDSSAQEQLYRAFAGATYALIRRLIARKAVADDLFQDTFVEVLQSLGSFRGEAPLGAWIGRVAASKCLMHLRSPWHRSLIWLDQFSGEDGCADVQVQAARPVNAEAGTSIDLQAALAQLPAQSRAVVWLHDVEGYTHEEIAALFGKSVSFSKSQLMRAHLRLRELLENERENGTCMRVSTNF
jgi:RNA polymerase sigma-70 factor (ECF subfamily)